MVLFQLPIFPSSHEATAYKKDVKHRFIGRAGGSLHILMGW